MAPSSAAAPAAAPSSAAAPAAASTASSSSAPLERRLPDALMPELDRMAMIIAGIMVEDELTPPAPQPAVPEPPFLPPTEEAHHEALPEVLAAEPEEPTKALPRSRPSIPRLDFTVLPRVVIAGSGTGGRRRKFRRRGGR